MTFRLIWNTPRTVSVNLSRLWINYCSLFIDWAIYYLLCDMSVSQSVITQFRAVDVFQTLIAAVPVMDGEMADRRYAPPSARLQSAGPSPTAANPSPFSSSASRPLAYSVVAPCPTGPRGPAFSAHCRDSSGLGGTAESSLSFQASSFSLRTADSSNQEGNCGLTVRSPPAACAVCQEPLLKVSEN